MKIKYLYFAITYGALTITNPAHCLSWGVGSDLVLTQACTEVDCSNCYNSGGADICQEQNDTSFCNSNSTPKCYKTQSGKYIRSTDCATCKSGYIAINANITDCPTITASIDGDSYYIQYSTCVAPCAKGTYHNYPQCTNCPSPGTTASTGTKSITDCYIPAGTYSDLSGAYKTTENCYYTKSIMTDL
ncbi:MAG: hypothetical protein NC311_03975 [Muribaculaceae bacterium]|nr:hypothetical protein [Muribaculaceae bacterium]